MSTANQLFILSKTVAYFGVFKALQVSRTHIIIFWKDMNLFKNIHLKYRVMRFTDIVNYRGIIIHNTFLKLIIHESFKFHNHQIDYNKHVNRKQNWLAYLNWNVFIFDAYFLERRVRICEITKDGIREEMGKA